jgi:hypothetical protein
MLGPSKEIIFREIERISKMRGGGVIYTFKEELYNVYKGKITKIIKSKPDQFSKETLLIYSNVEKVDNIDEALKLEKLRSIR